MYRAVLPTFFGTLLSNKNEEPNWGLNSTYYPSRDSPYLAKEFISPNYCRNGTIFGTPGPYCNWPIDGSKGTAAEEFGDDWIVNFEDGKCFPGKFYFEFH